MRSVMRQRPTPSLAMLIRHEIVNDVLAGIPVAVTYCPLCNTALVFNRRVGGRVLDFGTSGNLRRSDLVMWDRQTQSWWQQITGEAIVGDLTGTRLTVIAAQILSFSDFRDAHPEGLVLSRETGIYPVSTYEVAPYAGYDRDGGEPFLFGGDVDPRLPPLERVLTIELAGETIAYPFSDLRRTPVINDVVGGHDVAVFYTGGTLSPFAGTGAALKRSVGSTGVFDPVADELSYIHGEGGRHHRRADRVRVEHPGRGAHRPARRNEARADGARKPLLVRLGRVQA